MLTEVVAGPYTLRGISVGGVYTSIQVPELNVLFDCGLPIRSFAGTDRILISHGHPDHASGLISLLGIRTLIGKERPPQVFAPAPIIDTLQELLEVASRLHRTRLAASFVPVTPGEVFPFGGDLFMRAFATLHGVPSLGFQLLRRVMKLRPEYQHLPGPEIGRLRAEQVEGVFDQAERLEIAYATDTLANVLETAPDVLKSRVLILESTFVDPRRSVEEVRERMHIHLDELAARADHFQNEHLVLMHFSQAYSPAEVHALVRERLPEALRARTLIFAPESGRWFA